MMNHHELFHQALQRQNDRSAGMEMPRDMEQRVMERIQSKTKLHHWMYVASISAAACVLLLLAFYLRGIGPKEEPVTAQQMGKPNNTAIVGEKSTAGEEQLIDARREQALPKGYEKYPANDSKKPVAVRKTHVKNDPLIKSQSDMANKTTPAVSASDQLNACIARLEAEMEAVDDSVRSAHLEKLIAADYRLQQLVGRIVKNKEEQAMSELQNDSTANYINF